MTSEQPLFDRRGPAHDDRGPEWTVHQTAYGVTVCRPRYFALPERRDPQWAAEQIRLKGRDRFDVAQGERWDAPHGQPFVPLFAERVRQAAPWVFEGRYVAEATVWPALSVLRGFDGGLHRPALVMGQYDPRVGVLWIQREFRPLTPAGQPIDMQTHEFLGVCRYLCGQATLDTLRAEDAAGKWPMKASLAWIEQERARPFYGWEMPWISPEQAQRLRFRDAMAGHEAKKANELAVFSEANSLVGMYRQHGLALRVLPETWEHRLIVLDFLLRDGAVEGVPRLLIDPSCKTLLRALAGGLLAAPPGRRKPYVEDRYLEDSVDAFFNVVVAAFPLAHADRLAAEETRQRRLREQAAPPPAQAGGRYRAPQPGATGLTWGSLRGSFTETSHGNH